jgi:hypothetical protein
MVRRPWLAVLGGLAAMGLVGGATLALADDEDEDGGGIPEGWAPPIHGPDPSGSPGEVTLENSPLIPCWISTQAGPSGKKELILGHVYGELNSSGTPDAYDWAEVDPWGSFHFERASPGPSGTRSYLYNIKAEATTGGTPTSWNQTGCFNVGTSG